ncbi:MAG: ABC transporter permease subunit, partial [Gemmatimonadota bacterium]
MVALTLGADEITTFWKITVPQLGPGIISGALLPFTMSFDDFVIASFVSGVGSSTLPIVKYGMVRKNIEPSINAISTIILVATAVLIYLADRLGRDTPLKGQPMRRLRFLLILLLFAPLGRIAAQVTSFERQRAHIMLDVVR